MAETPDLDPMPVLDRRTVIRQVSALLGVAAFVGGGDLFAAVERARSNAAETPGARIGEFTAAQIALLDEIAETILPATRTPGAKAARTGAFMALMVTEAYSPAERQVFIEGMRDLDAAMQKAHQASFTTATPDQRLALLTLLDGDQKRVMDAQAAANTGRATRERGRVPYFRMMKELAMLGFFTSEIGCTQVLRYVESPGRYDPCVPYAPGEPAWALHA